RTSRRFTKSTRSPIGPPSFMNSRDASMRVSRSICAPSLIVLRLLSTKPVRARPCVGDVVDEAHQHLPVLLVASDDVALTDESGAVPNAHVFTNLRQVSLLAEIN